MPIKIREDSVGFHLLMYLDAATDIAETLLAPPSKWAKWAWCGKHSTYKSAVYRLVRSGFLEIIERDEKKYLSLTKTGKVQLLVAKSKLPKPKAWDGKWRMVFFDIPEKSKKERHELRRLLLKNGFKKMQASVYICPWPLNREAIRYLKEIGLVKYIRFGRMEEVDDDADLKKKFSLENQ